MGGLASLGLTFDQSNNGHLDFNAFTLIGTDFSNSAGVASFLGSASSGGFLKSATDALKGLEDPTAGLLKNAESDVKTQITNIGNQITTKQNQVDQLQATLTNQMAAADAMISSMEQQYSYLTSMFQAQQTADQLYK
jgi:flagellar capping protein FliD